jgi:predicted Zn-dependent protease
MTSRPNGGEGYPYTNWLNVVCWEHRNERFLHTWRIQGSAVNRGPHQSLITLLVLGFIAACTTTSDVRSMNETLRTDYAPLEEEQWAIGQADLYHREFTEQGLLYGDEAIVAYMGGVESRLPSQNPTFQDFICLFVLKSPSPNAFAMPNGNVYIHAGLFTTLENEDQLAAIASHEIAHVTERHTVKAVISSKNKLIGSHIVDFATGGFGLVYFGTYASIMNYSREQEAEADQVGISLLSDSRYQPQAMLEAFQSLNKYPELRHVKSSVYSSHPSFKARIQTLQAMVLATPGSDKHGEMQDREFISIKARMMEDSLKARLRHQEYNLALTIVDQADNFFNDSIKVQFYRGEVYRGFARFPEKAAREYHWIQTGKARADPATEEKFLQERSANLAAAIQFYDLSAYADPPYVKAFRRLGEIAQEQGQNQKALQYFTQYLELSPDARDRRYVEHAMDRLGRLIGETL